MASIIVTKSFPLNMYVLVINGLVLILQCSPVVSVSLAMMCTTCTGFVMLGITIIRISW